MIKKEENVTAEDCREAILALRDSLEIWGGKWKLMILLYLVINKNDHNHFMQILRGVPGISGKMLSKELSDMEMNHLITRIVHNSRPVMVEYKATPYAERFIPIAEHLVKWGMDHRQFIKSL